jgi:3-hydroxybutyryl-CoA dehydrogenase
MKLVEIARAIQTADWAVETVVEVAHRMGKETVLSKDSQGFITSRLIATFVNEALRLYEEGVASRDDIDKACRLAFNHPMGPFELLDLTGLDTVLYVLESLTDAFGDRFRPTQAHRNLVRARQLGRKTQQGMYDYREER